jgi:WD40 repeat protein
MLLKYFIATINNSLIAGRFSLTAINQNNVIIAPGNSNNGILYSNDKGQTFKETNITDGNFWASAINGKNAVAASATDRGILYSRDSGKTWQQTNKTDKSFRWISISPDGNTAIAVSDSDEGIWFSSNTGSGFSTWTTSTTTTGTFRSVAIGPDNINMIAAGNGTNSNGLYYSINAGRDWTKSTTLDTALRSVIISPDGNYAIAGSATGYGIWYSTKSNNGFVDWTRASGTSGNFRSIAISPDSSKAIAVSNSNLGIMIWDISLNGFNIWHESDKKTGNFSVVSISPDGNTALAGSNQDGTGIWQSTGNFTNWEQTSKTTGDFFSIVFTSDSKSSVAASDIDEGILYSSQITYFTLSPLIIDEGVDYMGTLVSDAPGIPVYSIVNQPGNYLYISGNIVYSYTPFSYYLTKTYSFIIEAVYDNVVILSRMTITIRDVPQPPIDIKLSKNTIAEDQPIGTLVGLLETTDPDIADYFSYTFVDGEGSIDNSQFTINNNKLITATLFNYDYKKKYSIRVKSTDSTNYWIERQLFVFVVIPIADGENISALVGISKQIILKGTGVSNQPLEFVLLSQPLYGLLTPISNGIYQYVSTINKVDTFNYLVKEGSMTSLPGTILINNFNKHDIDNIPRQQGTFYFQTINFDGEYWYFGTMRTKNFFQYIDFNLFGNWRFYKNIGK